MLSSNTVRILFVCIMVLLLVGGLILSKHPSPKIKLTKFSHFESSVPLDVSPNPKQILDEPSIKEFIGVTFYPNDAEEYLIAGLDMEWATSASQVTKDKAIVVGYDFPSVKAIEELKAVRIKLPCGEVYRFKSVKDIPRENLMCRCGNPNHYVIRVGHHK